MQRGWRHRWLKGIVPRLSTCPAHCCHLKSLLSDPEQRSFLPLPGWDCSRCFDPGGVCKLAYLVEGTAVLTNGAGDGGWRWLFLAAHTHGADSLGVFQNTSHTPGLNFKKLGHLHIQNALRLGGERRKKIPKAGERQRVEGASSTHRLMSGCGGELVAKAEQLPAALRRGRAQVSVEFALWLLAGWSGSWLSGEMMGRGA